MAESYSCGDIQVLRGLEPVRRRPGMYVGNTDDGTGLEHMITEVVDWGVAEHRRSKASFVRLANAGKAIVVEHDGDGFSITEDAPDKGIPFEVAFTRLHGMFAFGLPVANALSSELEAVTCHGGRAYRQRFARGEAVGTIDDLGPTTRTGTRVQFIPDESIFGPRGPSPARLRHFLRLRAAAHPRLTLLHDDTAFRAPDGAADLARHLGRGVAWRHDEPIRLTGEVSGIAVDVGILWTARPAPRARWLVNGDMCPHGSHVQGVIVGIQDGFALVDRSLGGVYPAAFREVVFAGLVMAINVTMERPRIEGQARERLNEPDVRRLTRTVVSRGLAAHLNGDDVLRAALFARMPRAG